ncbi:hypothetical protein Tco_1309069 [Tanacetum coccineum]
MVNYDNENENDDLGYRSKEYFDKADEEDGNNHSNGNVVKRGITRLYKFRREYGKPDRIKLSVTLDALNRISGKHIALFSSFLGDMVHEHIGLKILSWKKRYFDVDLTVKKLVKSAAAKMARSKSKKEIEPDEEPPRGTLWLKGRVNKDEEYPDDEIRSVGDKLKETEDKIKERTSKVDHGTDAMTFVLGKEKGGYARGVGSGVIYKSNPSKVIQPSSITSSDGLLSDGILQLTHSVSYKAKAISPLMNILQSRVALPDELTY